MTRFFLTRLHTLNEGNLDHDIHKMLLKLNNLVLVFFRITQFFIHAAVLLYWVHMVHVFSWLRLWVHCTCIMYYTSCPHKLQQLRYYKILKAYIHKSTHTSCRCAYTIFENNNITL